LFLKEDKKENFYYGAILSFFDPICISILLYFSNNYHHVFSFLYVLTLLFSGLLLSKFGVLVVTAYNAIVFLLAVYMANFELNKFFLIVVVLLLFVFSLSVISLKDYFKNIIRYLRIKDKNISVLEFFNVYLINNMHNGLIVVDENLKISFWNSSAGKILGKKYSDVLGKKLNEIYPDFCRYCTELASDHIEKWISVREKRICLTAKVSPISVEGKFVGNIIVLEDITKFKENQRINEQNSKLAAIGRLAAALAHEIRNPLASISGSVEMLEESIGETKQNSKLMKIILREIDGLNILISELLDFVKPIKLKKTECNLSKLIIESIDLIKFEKKISIDTKLDETIVYYGDANKLKQVFFNILKNSFDILDKKSGKINVELGRLKEGKIQIIFKDNGPGIDKNNLEKVFEPFFTTKEKGTGLGLATCHNIIVMHGGEIEVSSKRSKTVFKIII